MALVQQGWLGEAECSRKRIAAAGKSWHDVLGVEPTASTETVKKTFHELALLHHPDKGLNGGDADTFKLVQNAYELALPVVQSRETQQKATSLAVDVHQPGGGLHVVPVNSSKKVLRAALDQWEAAMDAGKSNHVPDDIPAASLDEVVEWYLDGGCVFVDVREPSEKFGGTKEPLPGAVSLGFTALTKSPETLSRQLAVLDGCRGKTCKVVCYSTHGGCTGTCAAACCALLDVFGFDTESVFALENGYVGWAQWAKQNKDEVTKMQAIKVSGTIRTG